MPALNENAAHFKIAMYAYKLVDFNIKKADLIIKFDIDLIKNYGMKILVCISKSPDTTSKISFTEGNSKFDENGVQYIIDDNGNKETLK